MNLIQVYQNPNRGFKGDNFILVGSRINDIVDPIYIDQFGNLYVPSGNLKFDYEGRYWYVGDKLICYGGSSNPKAPPVSIGFTSIKYDEKWRVQFVGKIRIGYDYYGRVSYLALKLPVYYRGEGFTTQIATIGSHTYTQYFNANKALYWDYDFDNRAN